MPRYPGFTRTTIYDIFIRRIKKKSKKPKRVCRAETARRTILCCFVTVAVRDDKYRIAGNTATVARYLLERDARNIVHGPCARQNRGTGAVSGTVQRSSSSSRRASSRRHVYVAGRNAAPRATPFSRRPRGMTVHHPPPPPRDQDDATSHRPRGRPFRSIFPPTCTPLVTGRRRPRRGGAHVCSPRRLVDGWPRGVEVVRPRIQSVLKENVRFFSHPIFIRLTSFRRRIRWLYREINSVQHNVIFQETIRCFTKSQENP